MVTRNEASEIRGNLNRGFIYIVRADKDHYIGLGNNLNLIKQGDLGRIVNAYPIDSINGDDTIDENHEFALEVNWLNKKDFSDSYSDARTLEHVLPLNNLNVEKYEVPDHPSQLKLPLTVS